MNKRLLLLVFIWQSAGMLFAQNTLVASTSKDFYFQETTEVESTLIDALASLSKKYDVYFSYDVSIVEHYAIPSNKTIGTDLESELSFLLKNTPLLFKKLGKNNYAVSYTHLTCRRRG